MLTSKVPTYCGDDGGGEVKGPGELPLDAGLVGQDLDDVPGEDFVVGVGNVVLGLKDILLELQDPSLLNFEFRL